MYWNSGDAHRSALHASTWTHACTEQWHVFATAERVAGAYGLDSLT